MKRMIYLLPVILLFFYTGCSNDNTTGPASSKDGRLKLTMVDSPAGYDEVNIVVNRVEVHLAGDTSSWMVINPVPHTYDLLQLVNGASVVLGDTFLTPGHYTQIRLLIGDSSNVVVNGTPYPLNIPSGMQTGIKLNHEFDIEAGNLYELMLDFDAGRSIHVTHGGGQYTLNPVIRVMPVVTSGSISGQVLPTDADAEVSTVIGEDTVSTYPNSEGFFNLMTLPADTYDVYINPNNLNYSDTTITGIEVIAGLDKNIGVINLSSP
jgi:hypothetical protein